jgi:hypothetical protein
VFRREGEWESRVRSEKERKWERVCVRGRVRRVRK